jgi:hypothetical protein
MKIFIEKFSAHLRCLILFFVIFLALAFARHASAQATWNYLDDDPVYGTLAFARANWITPLNRMIAYLMPGPKAVATSVRALNPSAPAGSQWSFLWPENSLGIHSRDNYASFYIPAINELWVWTGAYLTPDVDYWSGRFSFAECGPTPSANCGSWKARGTNNSAAFTNVLDMTATGGVMPSNGIDPAMAWAANNNVGLMIGGSNDDGVSTYVFEPKVGGPEIYKITRLTSSTTPRPPYRSQCMNCMVTDGTDFYLMGGYYGSDQIRDNRLDLWKFTTATRTWTQLPSPPEMVYTPVLTYDSDKNVLITWMRDKLYLYNIAQQTWSNITPSGLPCVTNQTGIYSPTARKHIFQGGTIGTAAGYCVDVGAFRKVVAIDITNAASSPNNAASLPASCGTEGGLVGRTDILRCEPWESSTWWQASDWKSDKGDPGKVGAWNGTRINHYPVQDFNVIGATTVSSGCISGSCLRATMWAWNNHPVNGEFISSSLIIPGRGGCSHATIGCVPQQEVYVRYYLKLSPNWSPVSYAISDGSHDATGGGKFPGLADATDTGYQCGNGGEGPTNGTECWSLRLTYQSCWVTFNGTHNVCAEGGNSYNTRLGFYPYMYNGGGINGTAFSQAMWDADGRSTLAGPCNSTYGFGGGTNGPSTTPPYCGIGVPGISPGVWHLVELHVKMNDVGSANGVMEAWLDGTLRYQKTNVIFRNAGHNNLGIRQFWLDIFQGGTGVLMGEEMYVYVDQLVIATGSRPGPWTPSGVTPPQSPPLAPTALKIQ